MAIDIRNYIMDAFIDLCGKKNIKKISISDILEKTNVSRQTFYNYFKDKADLILQIYLTRIIRLWHSIELPMSYYDAMLDVYHQYSKYKTFMKQALSINEQNCLADFMVDYCIKFDYEWHQSLYGSSPLPDHIRLAIEYHSRAAMDIAIWWIISDSTIAPESIVTMIQNMRDSTLSDLLGIKDTHSNPYSTSN